MGNPTPNPDTHLTSDAPQPGEANQKNQADASEADKRTIANVQKNQSDAEKTKPAFRSGN